MEQEQSIYNKRRLVALGVLIILLLIVIFLLWWWFVPKRTGTPQTGTPTIPDRDRVILPTQTQVLEPSPAQKQPADEGEVEILSLARNFTERYGSWSTDSSYQNLNDLFPRITARLRSQFEKAITTSNTSSEFKGTETTVLKMVIQHRSATNAGVLVSSQRVETDAELKETVTYHDLLVTMVKQGSFWYVDSAEWKS